MKRILPLLLISIGFSCFSQNYKLRDAFLESPGPQPIRMNMTLNPGNYNVVLFHEDGTIYFENEGTWKIEGKRLILSDCPEFFHNQKIKIVDFNWPKGDDDFGLKFKPSKEWRSKLKLANSTCDYMYSETAGFDEIEE